MKKPNNFDNYGRYDNDNLYDNFVKKPINNNDNNDNKRIKTLEKELKAKEDKINHLTQEYKNLLKKFNELDKNSEIMQINQISITEKNEKLEKKNKELETQLNDVKKILEEKNEKLEIKNKELETQLNDVKKNLEEKNESLKTISKKNIGLKNENNKLKAEKEEMSKKLINNHTEIENYKKEIKNKENSVQKLEIILQNERAKFFSMKKEVSETHKKFDKPINNLELLNNQLIEQGKQLENLTKNNEEKLNELSKYKEENAKLKTKIQQLKNTIQIGETKEEYLIKQAEEFYDVVIDINSINSLRNEGWMIKYNKERKEIYDKIVSEQTMKIGVLGLNNVGKSYLLSKIVESDIPTGYSIETKGISIKYTNGNNPKDNKGICILDSAGFETPLLKNKGKKNNNEVEINKIANKSNALEDAIKYDEIEDELSRDKAQTERFIEQLIISLSDMIILVIGKLTRTEQRLITRIKNMAKKNEKNKIKSIIIVHNLAQYNKIKEVENHIEQYIKKSATFEVIERDYLGKVDAFKGRVYLVENSDDPEDIEVYHFLMAKEDTEAGEHYNDFSIELIKNQYNVFNKRRAINIPDEIINLFSELSTDIIGEKMECEKIGTDKNIIKLKENQKDEKKSKRMHLQRAYIDQDGNYLKNKGKFEPKYSLYYYKEKKNVNENEDEDEEENEEYEKYLLLRLEIPGNIIRLTARSTDPKTEKFNGIVIKGIKSKDDFKEKTKEDFTTITDNRSYDEFTYFIELKRNLELSKTAAKGFTDIYEIEFDKRNKEKFFPKELAQNSCLKNSNSIDINVDIKKANNEKKKENKLMKIASGVYVMKFQLTERSYIPNK